jgi:hypothetical protein
MPQYGNKLWMYVQLKNGNTELVPSFEDWFRQIRALCYCEIAKYPHLRDPTEMPRAFFDRCFDPQFRDMPHDEAWAMLKQEFKFLR